MLFINNKPKFFFPLNNCQIIAFYIVSQVYLNYFSANIIHNTIRIIIETFLFLILLKFCFTS